MRASSFLFWQPQTDYLRRLQKTTSGKIILIVLNYVIWVFFFYLSYLLVHFDIRFFWKLLLATLLAEIIERFIKKKVLWRRPMFLRHDATPVGLVNSWYHTGSFPSGHAIKVTVFLLFLFFYPVFPIPFYLLITSLLLLFRLLMGFHYPVDFLGALFIGFFCWLPAHLLNLNSPLNFYLQKIFNFIFRLS